MKRKTSWESSHKWYKSIVANEGHYYHKEVILPKLLKLIDCDKTKTVLDLGCGQGVLARALPPQMEYTGIDLSPSLIKEAKRLSFKNSRQQFLVGDITKKLPLKKTDFDMAVILLALQNVKEGQKAIENASFHLKEGGQLLIVLNHPCFRIPRQSSWYFSEEGKNCSRQITSYLSPLEIPIQTNPSEGHRSAKTFSYHHPLSDYSHWLKHSHFYIKGLQELISNKNSTGSRAKAENCSRKEIPMFLIIDAKKIS